MSIKTLSDGTVSYFNFDQKSEIAVAWYVEFPANKGNIMAMVFRDSVDEPWQVTVRTRWYRDDLNTRESKDERQAYSVKSDPNKDPTEERQRLIDKTDTLIGILVSTGAKLESRISEHKSLEEFFQIWSSQPWTHATVERHDKFQSN